MSKELTIAVVNLAVSLILFALHTDIQTALFACVSVCLVAGVIYMERAQKTQLGAVQEEIAQIKEKVNGLTLSKGFGR